MRWQRWRLITWLVVMKTTQRKPVPVAGTKCRRAVSPLHNALTKIYSPLLTHFPIRPVRSSAGCRAPGLVAAHCGARGRVAISVSKSQLVHCGGDLQSFYIWSQLPELASLTSDDAESSERRITRTIVALSLGFFYLVRSG